MFATARTSADSQLGRRMIEARIDARVSQPALAKILGVSLQQVWEFESGLARPTAAEFFMIAAALEKDPGWFFRHHLAYGQPPV